MSPLAVRHSLRTPNMFGSSRENFHFVGVKMHLCDGLGVALRKVFDPPTPPTPSGPMHRLA